MGQRTGPGKFEITEADDMIKVLLYNYDIDGGAIRGDELKGEHKIALREEVIRRRLRIEGNLARFVYAAGMASHSGTDNYNKRLSRRRVDNVLNFLVQEGVPAAQLGRFEVEVLGESRAEGRENEEDRAVFLALTQATIPPPRRTEPPRPRRPRTCSCEVTEAWVAVNWGAWQRTGTADRSVFGGGRVPESGMIRWRRRVQYHLHITGTRRDCTRIRDVGARLLHEILDLQPSFTPSPTAIPPQFKIVVESCNPIREDLENRYYSLPRVQRIVTTRQFGEFSAGMPTNSAAGIFGIAGWKRIETLSPRELVDIVRSDRIFIRDGPPIRD